MNALCVFTGVVGADPSPVFQEQSLVGGDRLTVLASGGKCSRDCIVN